MILRRFEPKDIEPCIQLGHDMHAESDYSSLVFSDLECRIFAEESMKNPGVFLDVADMGNGNIIGMLGAMIDQPFFSAELIATDIFVYVRKPFRGGSAFIRLMRRYLAWSLTSGAKRVYAGTSAAIPGADAVYEKLGLARVGSIYRVED